MTITIMSFEPLCSSNEIFDLFVLNFLLLYLTDYSELVLLARVALRAISPSMN